MEKQKEPVNKDRIKNDNYSTASAMYNKYKATLDIRKVT
jgi:hypothetical protein